MTVMVLKIQTRVDCSKSAAKQVGNRAEIYRGLESLTYLPTIIKNCGGRSVVRWRCGVCADEVLCRVLSLNGEYVNLVCEKGHHFVAYGHKRHCKTCGEETIHLELLQWRTKPRSQFRVIGVVCGKCGLRTPIDGGWEDS